MTPQSASEITALFAFQMNADGLIRLLCFAAMRHSRVYWPGGIQQQFVLSTVAKTNFISERQTGVFLFFQQTQPGLAQTLRKIPVRRERPSQQKQAKTSAKHRKSRGI